MQNKLPPHRLKKMRKNRFQDFFSSKLPLVNMKNKLPPPAKNSSHFRPNLCLPRCFLLGIPPNLFGADNSLCFGIVCFCVQHKLLAIALHTQAHSYTYTHIHTHAHTIITKIAHLCHPYHTHATRTSKEIKQFEKHHTIQNK